MLTAYYAMEHGRPKMAIFDFNPRSILVFGKDGGLRSANAPAKTLLFGESEPSHDAIGSILARFEGNANRDEFFQALRISDGSTRSCRVNLRIADGSLKNYRCTIL